MNIEGEDDSWDFGSAAGFYLDATEPKWEDHYRMYTYVTKVQYTHNSRDCLLMGVLDW